MPVFKKGTFNVNLGVVSFGGEFEEPDRQCAWELYCEIVSRVAVVGKVDSAANEVFTGEVLVESLSSLYTFFQEARGLMRRYPVGQLTANHSAQNHLGFFIAGSLELVLRPFLEKWQASYRYWWEHQSDKRLPPFRRQAEFEQLKELLADWGDVRSFYRAAAKELAGQFKLPDVMEVATPEVVRLWQEETRKVAEAQ